MERFNQDELAPIHQAIMAITDPHQQAAALTKACNVAQQADERIREGGSIEPHAEADALTKAVISAVQSLAKREKGSPLSDAEMKQRQEAARSRKKDGRGAVGSVVAGAATGAAAGVAASTALRGARAYMSGLDNPVAGLAGMSLLNEQLKGGPRMRVVRAMMDEHRPGSAGANQAMHLGHMLPSRRSAKVGAAVGAGLGLIGYARRRSANKAEAERAAQERDGLTRRPTARENAMFDEIEAYSRRAEKSTKADLRKAVESLPLAKRAVAVALYNEGHHDDLRKFLGPALMAARAALPSVARSAASAGTRMFGAASGAASRAGAGAMAGGRAGMRGLASGAGKVKSAWNATRNSRMGGAAGVAMNGIMAADTVASGAKAAGSWARKNKRGLAVAGGVGAAGAAAGGAYAATRPRQPGY